MSGCRGSRFPSLRGGLECAACARDGEQISHVGRNRNAALAQSRPLCVPDRSPI